MLRVGAVLAGLAAVAAGELLKQHTFDQPFQEFDAFGAWREGRFRRPRRWARVARPVASGRA